ncbi:hypothetical protein J3458_011633 [Metarhizium acridum]|uniref:Retrotransposon gag domain-containing protein n=1 Tax=Metarhizium acridum (strain CQMa 102) TaxID=655827 RepID=E9DUY4_METAQ|nr:uncharacterized protein MAC_01517 [Metarhizium acridum CQMa 102]EFY92551.1 hypothetical protein MAC_01517 [Metarhizium acridum CQMa 102]KAG8413976.1 hypothetical protein J3458_011633 [Metarhizium acridum]
MPGKPFVYGPETSKELIDETKKPSNNIAKWSVMSTTKNNEDCWAAIEHLQAGHAQLAEAMARARAALSILQEEFRKLKGDLQTLTDNHSEQRILLPARQYVTDDLDAHAESQLREFLSLIESAVREAMKQTRAGKSVNIDDILNKLGHRDASSHPEFSVRPIRNPPTYDGNDVSKFRPWWSRVTAFMHRYAESFPSDKFKIAWLGSLLSDKARMWHDHRKKQVDRLGGRDSWDSYSAALQARCKDINEASRNYERMKELQYQGDTEDYLAKLLDLNDLVCWSGFSLRMHIMQTLPDEITRLVYTRRGKLPETDEDFLNAISEAGRIYETMLSHLSLTGNHPGVTGEKARRLRRRRARRRTLRKTNK